MQHFIMFIQQQNVSDQSTVVYNLKHTGKCKIKLPQVDDFQWFLSLSIQLAMTQREGW